jgi:thiamine biosynthesis protein ThiI
MKLLCLISGGIDSAVAAYLMLQKKHEVEFIHFHNWPFTSRKNWNKSKTLIESLAKEFKKPLKFHVIQHGANLVKAKKVDNHLTCVICRRGMLREAEMLAKKLGADALLTGENIAQVASQTMQNLLVEHNAIKIPIIQPLIGLNKREIIDTAKKVGTYELSVGVTCDCRAVPKRPSTRAKLDDVAALETKIDSKKLAKTAIKTLVTETIH